ncbi:helix-turn-helix transcriptional regulator [Streptomyces somaliensis]|uniref:Helix-turn-helix transcriptional regulator n=1 Tax=Streptomyces somaliensis (strain ATCC 33201 / DSM 40738 / JCM 12659 / KCTC 9044 / NCTC 11332 / NRRL B-12077 / IP 733) TaxID=1134445 RepID=A0AA44DHQ4_STRE0|nr:helix-turn-helix transcriptional regulator [Streptomyces somaliensis]NKY16421.1 helix-turn-helix transcriptional regulator [Streptomyces somaliensis DSM 40738]
MRPTPPHQSPPGPPAEPEHAPDAYRGEPADERRGTPAAARAAYETLTRRTDPPPAADADAEGPPPGDPGALPGDVRRWLAERRLLDEACRRVRSPQRALHELIDEHRSRIDRYREELHRGLEAVDDVLRLIPVMTPSGREIVEAEFFQDRTRLRKRMEDLDTLCREQLLGMRTAFPPREVLEESLESDLRLLERQVELRLLVAARAMRRPGVAQYVSALVDHGARVRVVPTVPLHLNVFDRSVTVMAVGPAGGQDQPPGDVILHSARLADSFVRVFDHHWATGSSAVPRTKRPGAGGAPEDYTPREREVLTLLAAGAKDEAIARRLGCSERTLRRLLASLVAKLGADSRFAAGVQAVRLGLLD